MSSVLVLIIIPEQVYEDEVRALEQISNHLYRKRLDTINEVDHNSVDGYIGSGGGGGGVDHDHDHYDGDSCKKASIQSSTSASSTTPSTTTTATMEKESEKTSPQQQQPQQHYPLERSVEDGLAYLGIVDATWQKTRNNRYHQIMFPVDIEDSDVVIEYFKSLGIGQRLDTSIGIIPFTLFCYNEELSEIIDEEIIRENSDTGGDVRKSITTFKDKQNRFLKSITARLTVQQVVEGIRNNATLTFDFVCYIIFSSWIAAMGLLDNSVISIVASMLVSPLMGPLMAITFGTVIKDWTLIKMGVRNMTICFACCLVFGLFYGLIALNFTEQWADWAWPTDMMRQRGLLRVCWVGTLVALPSGCACAVSLLSGNHASLVGVAISVSLLPPCVNAGLLYANAALRYIGSIGQTVQPFFSEFLNKTIYLKPHLMPHPKYQVVYNDNVAIESLILGSVSVLYFLINITNIYIGAILLLKIKEISPLSKLSPETQRFFQEDIKIVREYNEMQNNNQSTSVNRQSSSDENFGEQVLREWADIAGLDSEKFLRPEAREIHLQTLADLADDIQEDEVYQHVAKNFNPNNSSNLARRLSQNVLQLAQHNFARCYSNRALDRAESFNSLNRGGGAGIDATNSSNTSTPVALLYDLPTSDLTICSNTSLRQRRISLSKQQGHGQQHQPQHSSATNLYLTVHNPTPNSNGSSVGGGNRMIRSAGVQPASQNIGGGGGGGGSSNTIHQSSPFSFNENEIASHHRQIAVERERRCSLALLRRTLQQSSHLPKSLWPHMKNSTSTSTLTRGSNLNLHLSSTSSLLNIDTGTRRLSSPLGPPTVVTIGNDSPRSIRSIKTKRLDSPKPI